MRNLIFFRLAAFLLGTLAYYLATKGDSIPILLWIAPFFFILLVLKDRGILSLLTTFIGFFSGNFLGVYTTYSGTNFPIQVVLIPLLIGSLIFTTVAWVVSFAVKRWYAIFIFPVFWTAYLYLMTAWVKNGDFTGLSNFPQIQFLPIVQIVSLTGPLGLSFLLLLIPSGIAISCHLGRKRIKQAFGSLFFTMAIFAGVFGFGFYRLHQGGNSQTITIGLGAKNLIDVKAIRNLQKKDPIGLTRLFAERVKRLASAGAQVVLQPELSLLATPENETEIFAILAQAALENQVYVFAPIGLVKRAEERNAMAVFSPEGKQVALYEKFHLVSGDESNFTPGNTLAEISLSEGTIGLEICHDMDFYQPSREYSKRGVGMLLVPAEDYGVRSDGKWHAQVAILQSICGGVSLGRAAFFGMLSLSDPYGRILAWAETKTNEETYLIGKLPFGSGRTFYARAGNWFGLLNLFIALLFLGRLVYHRSK